jgi:hypothetical protein
MSLPRCSHLERPEPSTSYVTETAMRIHSGKKPKYRMYAILSRGSLLVLNMFPLRTSTSLKHLSRQSGLFPIDSARSSLAEGPTNFVKAAEEGQNTVPHCEDLLAQQGEINAIASQGVRHYSLYFRNAASLFVKHRKRHVPPPFPLLTALSPRYFIERLLTIKGKLMEANFRS